MLLMVEVAVAMMTRDMQIPFPNHLSNDLFSSVVAWDAPPPPPMNWHPIVCGFASMSAEAGARGLTKAGVRTSFGVPSHWHLVVGYGVLSARDCKGVELDSLSRVSRLVRVQIANAFGFVAVACSSMSRFSQLWSL